MATAPIKKIFHTNPSHNQWRQQERQSKTYECNVFSVDEDEDTDSKENNEALHSLGIGRNFDYKA